MPSVTLGGARRALCVTEGHPPGGAARSSHEALEPSGQQHRPRQLGAASGGDSLPRPGLSVSCSYEPRAGICFLWHSHGWARGLHNRNSGRGPLSTRLPPQLPARAPQPLTPAGSRACSYTPAGPTPWDTHATRGRSSGRAGPCEPEGPGARSPRPGASPSPCSQFLPPNRSGHSQR